MTGKQPIGSISYEYNADDGLSYSSPARGVWNIVHIGTLVPGGHQIYVCPTSCLRGVVLTTAELGAMDRLSTIAVGEDNILEGDMEETLHEGVRHIVETLPERPRLVMVFTSCIHHFLAVNYQRIYRLLREEYPDIDFVDCYMHPIMRRTSPPVPTLWRQMYRVLKPGSEPDPRQVSILGCEFPMGAECDAAVHLGKNGIRISDVTGSHTYDEFLEMSRSSLNLLFHKSGMKAAKDLKIRLGQPFFMLHPSFDYDVIDKDMRELSELLGIPAPSEEETGSLREMAERAAEEARETLSGTAVSVDGTAVDEPLSLCCYLLEHGIRVETLFVDSFTESEDVFQRLRALKPDLMVYSALNWNMRRIDRGFPEPVTAIGQRSAYFHDTNHFVDLVNGGGLYGYRGIIRLMELLKEAHMTEKDMRSLIQVKGWRCACGG